MKGSYTVNIEMEELAEDVSTRLRESFGDAVFPVVLVDQTRFSEGNCRVQTDTYQVYSYGERGYITVNIHFFQPGPAEALSVKTAVFPPVNDTSRKAGKIFDAIEAVILGRENGDG